MSEITSRLGVSIDPKTATQEERLEFAMQLPDNDAWMAMEIVVGRRLSQREDVQAFLAYSQYRMGYMTKEKFLRGFLKSELQSMQEDKDFMSFVRQGLESFLKEDK